jgi:hypothetical protein
VDRPGGARHADAYDVVNEFRSTFQRPLDKVTIQLRRFVGYECSADVVVAQRLKRLPTTLNKLGRQPSMDVTRMQDIGGCRAVLSTRAEIDAVLGRIGTHWKIADVYNYIDTPKASGYRAMHVVVVRDDRLIEIQLRTPGQHQWAVAVERIAPRIGASVKDGEGPPELLAFFALAARGIALEEAGRMPMRRSRASSKKPRCAFAASCDHRAKVPTVMPLIHFLLIYDHDRGELVQQRSFEDAAEAAAAYAQLEREHHLDLNLEIVLVGADSIETIQKTHGNYFARRNDLVISPYLEPVS